MTIIERHWYHKKVFILTTILFPLSIIFWLVSKCCYYLYKTSFLPSYKLPVPVVIIGNITVGGVGKTPLTIHLSKELTKRGIDNGVILRGYKSRAKSAMVVNTNDNSALVGDEALIYANNQIKVAIGKKRFLAGIKLLDRYPSLKIILCDDGLQHYSLKRDYEIAVVDATRNGKDYILPMGPYRENISRLKRVDAVVTNSQNNQIYPSLNVVQRIVLDKIFNPLTNNIVNATDIADTKIAALVAIGNPERFFNFLIKIGITCFDKYAFTDHYYFKSQDIPAGYNIILTTEKDYTKLAGFKNDKIWVVKIKTQLDSNKLITEIIKLVK